MVMSKAEPSPGQDGAVTPISLLERARRQDSIAWQRLVELYRPLVLFWCGARGQLGAEDAEDVTQEVFAAVAAHLADFRRDRPGDTFRGWLRAITRNELRLHHRRSQGKPRAQGGSDAWRDLNEVADAVAEPDEEERAQLGQVYRRALELVRGEFEPGTWQAFCLTVLDGRSTEVVAADLGMSVAAVRQSKSRVLRRVKQEVGDLVD
jgi:RNA polymerase sigma-70 factor (ECF subfamily)